MRSSTHPLQDSSVGSTADSSLGTLPRLRRLVGSQLARRTDRPWLALVVVPIALMCAVVTLHLILVLPLVALLWWWGSSETPWVWILGIVEAAWGIQWAALGLMGLITWPQHRALISVLWIAYALLVAGIGAMNRWRYGRRYGM